MIKSFIFDLDGTLLDSMKAWENIGNNYLKHKGINAIPENLAETLSPMSLLDSAVYFISEFHLNLTCEQIICEINEMISYQYAHEFPAKPGVHQFLEKNKHMKMCVATATDRPLVKSALQRLDLMKYFDFIITSGEVGNSKQYPDIYLEAAKKLDTQIHEVVVFEDALYAIRTAKSAGFYTVGVYEPCFEHNKAEIIREADCYVHNLNEYGFEKRCTFEKSTYNCRL